MRDLSSQEISNVSAAAKPIADFTTADVVPYAAAWFGGQFVGSVVDGLAQKCSIELVKTTMGPLGTIAGTIGSFLLGKYVTDKWVAPYL